MHDIPDDYGPDINPATGLPLIDDTEIDVAGNPFGTDLHTWEPTYDPGASYYPSSSSSFDSW